MKSLAPYEHLPILPWERQKDEEYRYYVAFCIYRDLGATRNLQAVKEELEKQHGIKWTLKKISDIAQRYNWADRVYAFEQYTTYLLNKKREEDLIKMAERHSRLALLIQERIFARLQSLRDEEISPSDLVRLLDVSTKLERLTLGEPTSLNKTERRSITINVSVVGEEGPQSQS